MKRSYEPEICRKRFNIAVLTPIVKLIFLAKASTHKQAVAGRVRPGVGLYWPDFPQYETSYIVRLTGLYWLGTLRYLDQIPWRAQLRLQKGVDPTICQSTAHQRNTGHRLLRKFYNYFLHNVIEGKAPGYSTLRRSSENNPTNKPQGQLTNRSPQPGSESRSQEPDLGAGQTLHGQPGHQQASLHQQAAPGRNSGPAERS